MLNKHDYVATEKLYLTQDGRVVPSSSVEKHTLLISPGHRMAQETALRYGLISPVSAEKVESGVKQAETSVSVPPPAAPPSVAETAIPVVVLADSVSIVDAVEVSESPDEELGDWIDAPRRRGRPPKQVPVGSG